MDDSRRGGDVRVESGSTLVGPGVAYDAQRSVPQRANVSLELSDVTLLEATTPRRRVRGEVEAATVLDVPVVGHRIYVRLKNGHTLAGEPGQVGTGRVVVAVVRPGRALVHVTADQAISGESMGARASEAAHVVGALGIGGTRPDCQPTFVDVRTHTAVSLETRSAQAPKAAR
ncbi:MAG: hypothetical protein ACI9WU_000590 [Myxococcota bacterium]|jgi:hypothetical protein